ncbi:MAG TPA: hypothetical protein PLV96_08665 [Methanoregulaceae archaeon]|nr:hypothetical protein [Methanoregulaceae archaeon]
MLSSGIAQSPPLSIGKGYLPSFIPAGNALVDGVNPVFSSSSPAIRSAIAGYPRSVRGGMGEHFKGSPDPITLICTGKRSR